MKKVRTSSYESGVALIFALGLLTLLSVLGVAFVTNSLTAQKIAANVGSRDEARLLMDSAVNRVMISLMAVLRQDKSTSDYSIIYSTNDINGRGAAFRTRDQLDDVDNSKLNITVPGQPKYDGSKSKASWVYIRDNAGNITGRMAYQVLPTGTSSMSLDQVLKGIYNPVSGAPAAAGSPAAWNRRIGFDIREFNIGQAYNAPAAFTQEWKFGSGPGYDDLPGDDSVDIVASFDNFFEGNPFKKIIGDTDEKKVWLRRWFSESKNASPEAYCYAGSAATKMEDASMYHRFNLGPLSGTVADAWYSRFKGFDKKSDAEKENLKNSEDIVNELFKKSDVFYPEDTAAPQGIGLPYLTRICKDKGSFEKIEDRRRQIAANLNDYCDSDSIPTSDVAADKWFPNTWTDGDKPKYTGNEKTPYINELALELKFDVQVQKTSNSGGEAVLQTAPKITPKLLVELVDIYGGANAGDYKAVSWINNIAYTVRITKATGSVLFTDGTTGSFTDAAVTSPGTLTSRRYSLGEHATAAEAAPASFSSGYAVAAIPYAQENNSALLPDNFLLTKENIKTAMGGSSKTIASISVASVELEIAKVSFDLEAVCLKHNDGHGVDFVTGPGTIEPPVADDSITFRVRMHGINAGPASNAWNYFYITGMEVRDPRQNLNFSKSTTTRDFKADASDWKCDPKVERGSGTFDAGTMTVNAESSTFTYTGKVNSCSHPNAPFSADDKFSAAAGAGEAGVDYDKEKVDDPAWLGAASNQHISTAYIRNAPMQSLWELGAIHRASAWETINIKRAVVPSGPSQRRIDLSENKTGTLSDNGTAYADGDAVILDQVKLTGAAYTSGKLDVNMLLTTPAPAGYTTDWDKNIVKALFCGIRYGQQIGDIYPTNPAETGTVIAWDDVTDSVITRARTVPGGTVSPNSDKYISRADFIEGSTDPGSGDARRTIANGFGLVSGWGNLSDAQQEEIIGKTANLLTAGATAPTTIQVVVIVQTIRSIAPPSSGNITVVRQAYKKNGNAVTNSESVADSGLTKASGDSPAIQISAGDREFKVFSFPDSDGKTNYVYFDEITSELRALVTIKRVVCAGEVRFQLYNVRFL
ncbi:MAG: hypothetical protein IJU70_06570 [Lentisphaeria bacterium]|nr:hypothetical protein [Lentisphaeria bacterium]